MEGSIDQRIIRTRRSTLQSQTRHWSDRALEELKYEPSALEAVVANHLDLLPNAPSSDLISKALRGLYYRKFASTPNNLLRFLEDRKLALAKGIGKSKNLDPITLLSADPSPADETEIVTAILRTARPLKGEERWLTSAIGLTQDWQETEPVPSRVQVILDWISDHLEESPANQVLVFAQDLPVVVELLTLSIRELVGSSVRSFHHMMSESELARVALDFQRNSGCRVLISDELGGEGRNFQNASAVVHFDLPWSVARIEQRIGRLDRVGRGSGRPVKSIVCVGCANLEGALFDIHKNVFQVFSRSIGGLEFALPRLQMTLNQAICDGAEEVLSLLPVLKEAVDKELGDVDEAFELALDASKLQLKDAQELAQLLDEPADAYAESIALIKWAEKLGISGRRSKRVWEFQWDSDTLARPISGLRSKGIISGTFDRKLALRDESQQLFGPGHPFVDGLIKDLDVSEDGRATLAGIQLGSIYKKRIFVLIIAKCSAGTPCVKGGELSPGLKVRAHRYLWPQVEPILLEICLGQTVSVIDVTDPNLISMFRSPDSVTAKYMIVPANVLGNSLDTSELWSALDESIAIGMSRIKSRRKGIPESAAQALQEDLGQEVGFLKWHCRRLAARKKVALQREIDMRTILIENVRNETIELEGLGIFVGVE